ncbi:glycosyltransferase family 2 protein [Vibrio cholerae]|nr:glycosyltransferase family 2 protein [Vibrio cholerae]
MATNILILAAGQAVFDTHDNGYPLCLTETDGTSLIEKIISNTRKIADANYAFAISKNDSEKYHLDKAVSLLVEQSQVVKVPDGTKGSACTALLVASQLELKDEILVISANELVNVDFSEVIDDFKASKLDAGTLTFNSIHPRYSYVKIDEADLIIEAAQKMPISKNATAGVFWFKSTGEFVEGVKNMIRKDASVDGNFYIAPVFNELILKQKRVGHSVLDVENYKPIKNERQMYNFEIGIG